MFKLDSTGQETELHSFAGPPDGKNPSGPLFRDSAGNLYGTTQYGGASNFGVVFQLDSTGHETVLHCFAGGPEGAYPSADLIRDLEGNLYGNAGGGARGGGVVFKLAP